MARAKTAVLVRAAVARARTAVAGGEYLSMYVLRVLRGMTGEARDVLRGRTAAHERLRDTLAGVVLATVGVDLACAVLALLFEHGAKQSQVTSLGGALFWTTTQLLTVSSSLQNPISTPGRILDIVMEIYAITVIGTLAGAFGAFLGRRGRELERDERSGR